MVPTAIKAVKIAKDKYVIELLDNVVMDVNLTSSDKTVTVNWFVFFWKVMSW